MVPRAPAVAAAIASGTALKLVVRYYLAGVARLYAAKLGVRLRNMLTAFTPKAENGKAIAAASFTNVREIQDPGFIRNGVLTRNYVSFPAVLSRTSSKASFLYAAKSIGNTALSLVEKMATGAPGSEIEWPFACDDAEYFRGPGWKETAD